MTIHETIRARKTVKVMSPIPLPANDLKTSVEELVSSAGWAPFHRACDDVHRLGSSAGIEPWRFYLIDSINCRQLSKRLPESNAGKIPTMLNAADALAIVTWLPNNDGDANRLGYGDQPDFAPTVANMEHIAAASAAIQNLLLLATEKGIANYWSSGGVLRTKECYELVGIPSKEILLGAIFLFPSIGTKNQELEIAESKLRSHRTGAQQWSRWAVIA